MESEKQNKRRRPWLVCVLLPVMVGCVLCAAQAGFLMIQPNMLDKNIRPFATADYSPWSFVRFQPVNPQLETLIVKEENGEEVSVAVLTTPTLTPPASVTPLPTLIPTNTARPSSTLPASATLRPSGTPSQIPTNTQRPTFTLMPSRTATLTLIPSRTATLTAVPTLTRTATASITSAPTLTRTSTVTLVPSATATLIPTATLAPSQTLPPTATPIPTDTLIPPSDTPIIPTNTLVPDTPIPPTDIPTDIPTVVPTPYSVLELTTLCSPNPALTRVWIVRNFNTFPVNFDWALVSGTDSGTGIVPAAVGAVPGEIAFTSTAEAGPNTMNLFANGGVLQDTEIASTATCANPPCTPATIDVGNPDNAHCSLNDGVSVVLALSPAVVADGNTSDYELVYYERLNGASIFVDWVSLEVSQDGVNWFTVFYFGDGIDDANTNLIPTYAGSGEPDNYGIPQGPPLYGSPLQTGITIDIDAIVPSGTYLFLRITSLGGGTGESAEIDAIDTLP